MKYEIYIDRNTSLELFEMASKGIVARLDITDTMVDIKYDYDKHKFCIRTPYDIDHVLNELSDIYIITLIEQEVD
jgi:hypothetical protein